MKEKNINNDLTLKLRMTNNKIITLLILGIFFIGFVGAEYIGEKKINRQGEIINFCESGNCTFMNLTSLELPNGTVLYLNAVMTKNVQEFNYSYTPDQLGTYTFKTCGNPDGFIICDSDTFKSNPTGEAIGKPEANFYFIILFLVFLLLGLFVIISIRTPYENKKELTRDGWAITAVTKSKYVKLMSMWISYGLFLIFVKIITGISNNYIFFEGLRDIISNLDSFLSILGWGVNLVMMGVLIWLIWNDIILNKEILKEGKKLLNGNP